MEVGQKCNLSLQINILELFVNQGIPQSNGNTWQMYIYPEMFTYRLIRQGREFRVDFDLTKPIKVPAAPWGYAD
jgi:hypothetical protein